MLSIFSKLLLRGREENKLFFKIEVCSKYFVQDCPESVRTKPLFVLWGVNGKGVVDNLFLLSGTMTTADTLVESYG